MGIKYIGPFCIQIGKFALDAVYTNIASSHSAGSGLNEYEKRVSVLHMTEEG